MDDDKFLGDLEGTFCMWVRTVARPAWMKYMPGLKSPSEGIKKAGELAFTDSGVTGIAVVLHGTEP